MNLAPFNPDLAVPPGDSTNGHRAERANKALMAHKLALGESGPLCGDQVVDLLTDLMHWVHREAPCAPERFYTLKEWAMYLRDSRNNFIAESGGAK